LQIAFTRKYFCVRACAKYRVKAVQPFRLCARDAIKNEKHNRQYTEQTELARFAAPPPHQRHLIAFLITGCRIAIGNSDYTWELSRADSSAREQKLPTQDGTSIGSTRYARASCNRSKC
jgi:hypothetical protein